MNNNKSILIVEDDALTAYWLGTVLQKLGYNTIESVLDGESAVESACLHKPDLVIMDVWLSGTLNGVESAALIQDACNSSVIFISGYPESDLIPLNSRVKYLAYLKKPFEGYDLEEALAKMEY